MPGGKRPTDGFSRPRDGRTLRVRRRILPTRSHPRAPHAHLPPLQDLHILGLEGYGMWYRYTVSIGIWLMVLSCREWSGRTLDSMRSESQLRLIAFLWIWIKGYGMWYGYTVLDDYWRVLKLFSMNVSLDMEVLSKFRGTKSRLLANQKYCVWEWVGRLTSWIRWTHSVNCPRNLTIHSKKDIDYLWIFK